MTFRDRYYLALLNIRKSKFKSILFVLTTLIFFLILSIFFTAKKSVEDFFNDYLNSDFSNRIIAVEVGENDRNDIVNQIEKLNNKHISKVFHSNYELFLQAKIESEDNKINGYASLYGNYDGINYTINYGHDIENDNEIICSSSFYPGNYDNETSDSLFELSKYLNSNFKISYNKDKIDIDSISGDWNIDTIEEYSKNLKLVGTFDIKEDLTQYNMCYVSSEMLENILNSNKVFENKEDEKIFFDGLPALVLVDKYENVQNIINELNNMSYNAYLAYELDTESIQSVFNIINVLTIIIVIFSLVSTYLFLKNSLKENKEIIYFYKTMGYYDKDIKGIIMWQFVTLLIITFLINILAIIILKPIVEYILGKYPLYSVLSIHISIFETLLFCFLTIIIILVLINIYMKKLSNKI